MRRGLFAWENWAGRVKMLAIPLWFPAFLFGILPAGSVISSLLGRLRRHRCGLCMKCGYNLTGNTTGVCPECGTAFVKKPYEAQGT